jgi:hypothetical protein
MNSLLVRPELLLMVVMMIMIILCFMWRLMVVLMTGLAVVCEWKVISRR